MKSAIITGGGGFLGSHLATKLVSEGYKVIAVDNFCTGDKANKAYLQTLGENVHFVEEDVTKEWTWLNKVPASFLEDLKYVFHFASPASPPLYQKLSIETMWVNTIGLENAIKCADSKNARVIFASTSEVYGDPSVSPQPENYWGYVNSYGERSCYDEAKRFGEALIFSYNLRHKTRHGMVRIFNTYGPRMNPYDGRVVINFLAQGLKGEDLTVYGDGLQTRSFCFVDDLIAGIYAYAQKDLTDPVNVGNPTEFTILQLAEKVQKIFSDKNLKICHKPLPSDDPKLRRPDISKGLELLAPWKPQVSLDQGLVRMLAWLKERGC